MKGLIVRITDFLPSPLPVSTLTVPCSAAGSPMLPPETRTAASRSGAFSGSGMNRLMKPRASSPGAQTSRSASAERFRGSRLLPSSMSKPRHLRRSTGLSERSCVAFINMAQTSGVFVPGFVTFMSSLPSGMRSRLYLPKSARSAPLTTPFLSSSRRSG